MEKSASVFTVRPPADRAESDATTTRHLAAARYCLPEELPTPMAKAAWAEVEHHLHCREVRSALDCAMRLGNDIGAGKDFWREILLATRDLELDAHANQLAQFIRLKEAS